MMRGNYARNKALARFKNTEPSKTDQSQAADTDINVIVKRYGVYGTAPGTMKQPLFADFSQIGDLRQMIEQTRDISRLRRSMPKQLAEMPLEDLLALNEEQLKNILAPPGAPPSEKKEEQK